MPTATRSRPQPALHVWEGQHLGPSADSPTGHQRRRQPRFVGLDLVADWRDQPTHFAADSVDVLVWDPIHVADVGANCQLYRRSVATQSPVSGSSVTHLYPAFLDVAAQLVKPRTGICLVKMCDQVHSGPIRGRYTNL